MKVEWEFRVCDLVLPGWKPEHMGNILRFNIPTCSFSANLDMMGHLCTSALTVSNNPGLIGYQIKER